jgi:hypothetical protein
MARNTSVMPFTCDELDQGPVVSESAFKWKCSLLFQGIPLLENRKKIRNLALDSRMAKTPKREGFNQR